MRMLYPMQFNIWRRIARPHANLDSTGEITSCANILALTQQQDTSLFSKNYCSHQNRKRRVQLPENDLYQREHGFLCTPPVSSVLKPLTFFLGRQKNRTAIKDAPRPQPARTPPTPPH